MTDTVHSTSRRYVVVTPARDEEAFIGKTLDAVIAQTRPPLQWVIVNDGSTDGTGAILDDYARRHDWIHAVHRGNRGHREPGGGVMETFYEGYAALTASDWDFVVKLDGDLSFAPDYFEQCLARFEQEPRLGIAGGVVCADQEGGAVVEESRDPAFHVRGATKIYRRACWEAITPLIRAPGWDTLDELKANMLGWRTRTLRDLPLIQHRATGGASGRWPNSVKNGKANYICGYHPLFMFLKCVRRLTHKPYLIDAAGLAWGFLSGYIRQWPQVDDPALIQYIRRQQINRLVGRDSLWKPRPTSPAPSRPTGGNAEDER